MIGQSRSIAQTVHTKRSKKDDIFVGVVGYPDTTPHCTVLYCSVHVVYLFLKMRRL